MISEHFSESLQKIRLPQKFRRRIFSPEGTGNTENIYLTTLCFSACDISESQTRILQNADEKFEKVINEATAYFKGECCLTVGVTMFCGL